MSRTMYGLRNKTTNGLCSFYYTSNLANDGGGDYAENECRLESPDDTVWLVNSREVAERVLNNKTNPSYFYSGGYETPTVEVNLDNYEVVEVTLNF